MVVKSKRKYGGYRKTRKMRGGGPAEPRQHRAGTSRSESPKPRRVNNMTRSPYARRSEPPNFGTPDEMTIRRRAKSQLPTAERILSEDLQAQRDRTEA